MRKDAKPKIAAIHSFWGLSAFVVVFVVLGMGKRILVVGAGWLGKPLALALQANGNAVTVTTTTQEKCDDLRSEGLDATVLVLGDPGDRPVLLPAEILVVTVPPRGGQERSELVMRQLAEAASKAKIPQVIYCSSTAVYPDLNRDVFLQDAADFPSAHSGVRLLFLEHVFTANPSFQTAILRLGGLFGPGRHPSRFLRPGIAQRGAENPVNMAHLDDCIQAILETVAHSPVALTRNVVRMPHLTRREFYSQACKEAGLPEPEWTEEAMDWKRVMG